MPRPQGRFTYDATLKRFRNAAGQLIPDSAILPTAITLTVSHEDAFEMLHHVEAKVGGTLGLVDHVAGAATPEWIKHMKDGLRQPCSTCGSSLGLGDVTLSGTHTRDWSE